MARRWGLSTGSALTTVAMVLGLGVDASAEVPPAAGAPGSRAPSSGALDGDHDGYRPALSTQIKDFRLAAPLLLGLRGEGVSGFPVDRDRNLFQSGLALSPLLRIGLRLDTTKPLAGKFLVFAEYEHDVPTGTWTTSDLIAGAEMPNGAPITTQLRKLWGRFSIGPYLHVGGGLMTSHWGMGLVANDGAHRWEPGSARFSDPRGGDLVTRAFLATGPLTSAAVLSTLAVEKVRSDSVLVDGDSAYQLIASVLLGHEQPTRGGYFLVHRHQSTPDGRVLDVNVIDLAARTTFRVGKGDLTLEAEGAVIEGRTTFAATPEVPRSDVLQVGAAARASLAFEHVGFVLDLLYGSGDDNTHDARITAFHANPNFETGLLMFRYMQAAQTGRGYGTAADPQIVGSAAAGVERFPTRGGFTNTLGAFPRFWVRPYPGLETYGGVLVALAPVKNLDPLNTEIAGGQVRNAVDGRPGSIWGMELDLGTRYRIMLHHSELTAGAEAGVLFPGSAVGGVPGYTPSPVFGGRLMLTYRL